MDFVISIIVNIQISNKAFTNANPPLIFTVGSVSILKAHIDFPLSIILCTSTVPNYKLRHKSKFWASTCFKSRVSSSLLTHFPRVFSLLPLPSTSPTFASLQQTSSLPCDQASICPIHPRAANCCCRQEAQNAIAECRALKTRLHLAEEAQKAARSAEEDYETVLRVMEKEIGQPRNENELTTVCSL